MDNAGNNNTLIKHLSAFFPNVRNQSRLRCAGHIINLIVKAILFGGGISKFEREILGCSDKDKFNLWRKRGPHGKLHNTIRYINRSDQRRQEFASYQHEAADDDEIFDWIEKVLIVDGGGKVFLTHIF
jgi:hypothetical protein